jgi:2'-5' RNA ligase
MIRLFVGLSLPEDVSRRLALLGGGIPGARWMGEEQLHLTLRFIGEVDGARYDDIRLALSAVQSPAFPLTLAGMGHFGDGRKLRALWADVASAPDLIGLQERVESVLVRAGVPAETRKFKPHVTLARLRDAPAGRVAAFLAAQGLFSSGPFRVDEFHLFSSHPSSEGSVYDIEESYTLD